jgi:hypothetical protein
MARWQQLYDGIQIAHALEDETLVDVVFAALLLCVPNLQW